MTSIQHVHDSSTAITAPQDVEENSWDEADDTDNIPYHAREYAKPFTYGALPDGFKTSELNHVTFEPQEASKPLRTATILPPSPSFLRKSIRPSISPSRPVLHKTPSRQEFEEMLLERREQALREQNNVAVQLAQNASIQKDLDELQEKLSKSGLIEKDFIKQGVSEQCLELLPHVPPKEENDTVKNMEGVDVNMTAQTTTTYEPALLIAETSKRPETPAFPIVPVTSVEGRCVSPYPLVSPSTQPVQHVSRPLAEDDKPVSDPHEVAPHLVKFAKDSSEYWYKPYITREESVALLRHAAPGTFIIRNSTTYKNAYGLVLRVVRPPPGVVVQDANNDELVRHFLIEPTTFGVRLKGCANEPIFTSLSALVYQHSMTPLALPCALIIPDRDLVHTSGDADLIATQKLLLAQGAACNVLYLLSCDMESLTGDEAVRKAVGEIYTRNSLPKPVEVHFKVSQQGITLTDNTRSLFFRRHYIAQNISHMGIDPDNRLWTFIDPSGKTHPTQKTIFAFVARPLTGTRDNQCHVFCDLAVTQPASAIISFANKVLPMDKHLHKML